MLGGCETVEDVLIPDLPDPPCEDVVEVDAVTGRAELVLDASACFREEEVVPARVEYASLADRDWEPLVRADANPCNTGSASILVLDVSPHQLAVDPTGHPAYASEFVDGVWMHVRYWGHRTSLADWSTFFRFGHPEDVVEARDCRE